jgi:hypothetical protein
MVVGAVVILFNMRASGRLCKRLGQTVAKAK